MNKKKNRIKPELEYAKDSFLNNPVASATECTATFKIYRTTNTRQNRTEPCMMCPFLLWTGERWIRLPAEEKEASVFCIRK